MFVLSTNNKYTELPLWTTTSLHITRSASVNGQLHLHGYTTYCSGTYMILNYDASGLCPRQELAPGGSLGSQAPLPPENGCRRQIPHKLKSIAYLTTNVAAILPAQR